MDTQCQPSFRSTGSPRRVVKAVHSGGGKARPPPSCASDGCLTLVGQPLGATLPGPCPRAAASAYVPGSCPDDSAWKGPEPGVCTRRTVTMKTRTSTRTRRCMCCLPRRPAMTVMSHRPPGRRQGQSTPLCPSPGAST